MDTVFARKSEVKILNDLYNSGKPEFLAIYGRRRVGKTFLIREFFKQKGLYFALTGVKGASIKKQLKNFTEEFNRVFPESKLKKPPRDWQEAFSFLRQALEQRSDSGRIILFFDELPWLASRRSGFLEDLDHFWNRYMSGDNRIVLIVCGSAASWMIKKIIRNKGGLHGRLTGQIRLIPFDLKETEEFLRHKGVTMNRKAIADIYMAIGGIPKYLNYVQNGQSAAQIIGHLCFNGPLVDEFDELYASLFDSHSQHEAIVKALAAHPYGLTKSEIAEITKIAPGGTMNSILEELEQSGFILPMSDFGKKKKDCKIRLVDEYSLFYLKWSEQSNQNDQFWINMFNTPQGQIWAGYAFEVLCLKHAREIKKALGIAGVITNISGWTLRADKNQKGTQIDLLIDRADNCINLCEIKYSNKEFVIDKSTDQALREKKEIFLEQTKIKKSVFLTLISPYGVKKNIEYFGTADVTLALDDLFN